MTKQKYQRGYMSYHRRPIKRKIRVLKIILLIALAAMIAIALYQPKKAHSEPSTGASSTPVNEYVGTMREVTAYNSVPEQTDSTPCIAADGSDICERREAGEMICATNAFPLGTKLYIRNVGECTVADRMNDRYQERVDLFFGNNTVAARQFGLNKLYVAQIKNNFNSLVER